jgi:hypothetical protein
MFIVNCRGNKEANDFSGKCFLRGWILSVLAKSYGTPFHPGENPPSQIQAFDVPFVREAEANPGWYQKKVMLLLFATFSIFATIL